MTSHGRAPERATALADELDALREENRQLRALLLPPVTFPASLRLTPLQHRLLAALVAAGEEHASHDRLTWALYGSVGQEEPEYHAVAVYVSRLRAKLRRARIDVAIENLTGIGWRLAPGGAARLRSLTEASP